MAKGGYDKALGVCATESAVPATVYNAHENRLVQNLANIFGAHIGAEDHHAWLGYHDKSTEGTFVWEGRTPMCKTSA